MFKQICQTQNIPYIEGNQIVNLYNRNTTEAVLSFKLPGWKYNLAVNSAGDLIYDHWGSEPNSIDNLHNLVQDYNVQSILSEVDYKTALGEIDFCENRKLKNGDIELILNYE